MEPIPFDESNATLSPPEEAGGICELPICAIKTMPEGKGCFRLCRDGEAPDAMLSRWKMTVPEIEEIVRTGEIWLVVIGSSHPFVGISAQKPFRKAE